MLSQEKEKEIFEHLRETRKDVVSQLCGSPKSLEKLSKFYRYCSDKLDYAQSNCAFNDIIKTLDPKNKKLFLLDIARQCDELIALQGSGEFLLEEHVALVNSIKQARPIDNILEKIDPHQPRIKKVFADREKIISANLYYVESAVETYSTQTTTMEKEEIYLEAYIGLNKAIDKFDSDKGERFYSLAPGLIQVEIKHAINYSDSIIDYPNRKDEEIIHIGQAIQNYLLQTGISTPPSIDVVERLIQEKGFSYIPDRTLIADVLADVHKPVSYETTYKGEDIYDLQAADLEKEWRLICEQVYEERITYQPTKIVESLTGMTPHKTGRYEERAGDLVEDITQLTEMDIINQDAQRKWVETQLYNLLVKEQEALRLRYGIGEKYKANHPCIAVVHVY
jgi:DNA-directed RNA polymerase sigma subunit (sigma70/sigma32)